MTGDSHRRSDERWTGAPLTSGGCIQGFADNCVTFGPPGAVRLTRKRE